MFVHKRFQVSNYLDLYQLYFILKLHVDNFVYFYKMFSSTVQNKRRIIMEIFVKLIGHNIDLKLM